MNAPTLIVGLGGSGSTIVQKVYQRATAKQRENIGFVIFDTDVNELRGIEEKMPKIRTIQISTRLTVGEYLDIDEYARDSWFPVNPILNAKALTEGAGQVRSVSRLALNTAIQQGRMSPLNESIEELYKLTGEKTQQAPRVIVTGSLCGGTGSGLILPVCLYIRNYMTTKLQHGTTIIRGFFLLPEVFDGVIRTQSERNNLKSNAYAAVREINAFMLKDADALPASYDLHFMAPRAGSTKLDEYTGNPMDFCFLFDAQNLNGMTLNSFEEYKDHAANCIYGMAIAPTSIRSNSSEDNVIREIIASKGRTRFAGSGTSLLIYPTDDVKHYIGLKWTKESISNEWLKMDEEFNQKYREYQKAKENGVQMEPIDRGTEYINAVNEGMEESAFLRAVRSANIEYDKNGYIEKKPYWKLYSEAVTAYIKDKIRDQKKNIKSISENVSASISNTMEKKAGVSEYLALYEVLVSYLETTRTLTKNLAQSISFTLYKDNSDWTKTTMKYRMEYWLREDQSKEKFHHPNAVRYFIYNAIKEFDDAYRKVSQNLKESNIYFEDFESQVFDTDDNPETKETPEDYFNQDMWKVTGLKKLLNYNKLKGEKEELDAAFSTYRQTVDEYWELAVKEIIYKEALGYMNNIARQLEEFYDVLGKTVGSIDKSIEQLEAKYQTSKKGDALRYVCANEKCLKGLAGEVRNPNVNSLTLPTDICREIFLRAKNAALSDQKIDLDDYYRRVFNETIVKYLEDLVETHNSSIVNMDIISALQKEAQIERDGAIEGDDLEIYIAKIIEESGRLAVPFIESPAGQEPRIIDTCAYNPSLSEADIPGRTQFVNKNLKSKGGVDDDSIDSNMILFYQAVYGLRPTDLSKFAPQKNAETMERPSGEYYKAYFEQIEQIDPVTTKSKVITPHIDRWWHVITKLPDISDENQEAQEAKIYRAFFWGIVGDYIRLEKINKFRSEYKVNNVNFNKEKDFENLIVSNGTACDHLYEVLDAFTIFPYLCTEILEDIKLIITKDRDNKRPFAVSKLKRMIDRFEVKEEILNQNAKENTVRSVLELPILMKLSVPAEQYDEKRMMHLTRVILEELRAYTARFTDESTFASTYGTLLKDQFNKFQQHVEDFAKQDPEMLTDKLFVYICQNASKEFESIDLFDESDAILDYISKVSN
ncbi:MAG: hypothetical protein IKG46_12780 [Solobacterium sp.]|nr:hypothetical protein [Solobacterium sp.]